MNIKDIQQLIKFVAKSGVSEVKIESKDLKIAIKTGSGDKPIVYSHPQAIIPQTNPPINQEINLESATEMENDSEESNLITIKSPIIGTFYRKPSPDKANFIEIGDSITEGDVLCVIEAMKFSMKLNQNIQEKLSKF